MCVGVIVWHPVQCFSGPQGPDSAKSWADMCERRPGLEAAWKRIDVSPQRAALPGAGLLRLE